MIVKLGVLGIIVTLLIVPFGGWWVCSSGHLTTETRVRRMVMMARMTRSPVISPMKMIELSPAQLRSWPVCVCWIKYQMLSLPFPSFIHRCRNHFFGKKLLKFFDWIRISVVLWSFYHSIFIKNNFVTYCSIRFAKTKIMVPIKLSWMIRRSFYGKEKFWVVFDPVQGFPLKK